jgi:hypothetical protein
VRVYPGAHERILYADPRPEFSYSLNRRAASSVEMLIAIVIEPSGAPRDTLPNGTVRSDTARSRESSRSLIDERVVCLN